jgi:DNA polymerase-3 subunit delta'
VFDDLIEQTDARRLLEAAVEDGPVHAYLFHGPRGVGKWQAAIRFAAELLGERRRVEGRVHPDLFVLEPLGDQIRIDEIRALRRDLHMRPFEAERRVYVIRSAHLLNEQAADALLKDLEEPPSYAVVLLLADELGPLPETIRSRCRLVPFRRLSERAVRSWVAARHPGLSSEEATAVARVAGGRLDRADALGDEDGRARRAELLAVARSVYADERFEPSEAADRVLALVAERSRKAREAEEERLEDDELTERQAEQRLRRAEFGAQRDGVLEALEELAAWYRDLVVVAVGAEKAALHVDRLVELHADVGVERLAGAERSAELVRETWRRFEELNLQPKLALEALFTQLRGELAA